MAVATLSTASSGHTSAQTYSTDGPSPGARNLSQCCGATRANQRLPPSRPRGRERRAAGAHVPCRGGPRPEGTIALSSFEITAWPEEGRLPRRALQRPVLARPSPPARPVRSRRVRGHGERRRPGSKPTPRVGREETGWQGRRSHEGTNPRARSLGASGGVSPFRDVRGRVPASGRRGRVRGQKPRGGKGPAFAEAAGPPASRAVLRLGSWYRAGRDVCAAGGRGKAAGHLALGRSWGSGDGHGAHWGAGGGAGAPGTTPGVRGTDPRRSGKSKYLLTHQELRY